MYLYSMYLPTREYFKNEINELKNNLIIDNIIKIKDEGILTEDILNIICKDLNIRRYKSYNYIEDLKKNITKAVIELDNNINLKGDYIFNNKTGCVLFFDSPFEQSHLEIVKGNAVFEITSLLYQDQEVQDLLKDQKIVIKDDNYNILENKINSYIKDDIKTYKLSTKENSIIAKFGGNYKALLEVLNIKHDNYLFQFNQLTNFQKLVLKSRILYKPKTSMKVKHFVGNSNSSSILDALNIIINKGILNKDLQFNDNFFKLWLLENFGL